MNIVAYKGQLCNQYCFLKTCYECLNIFSLWDRLLDVFYFLSLQLKGTMCWKAPFWSHRYKVIIKWAQVSFKEKKRFSRESAGVFLPKPVFIQNLLLEANKNNKKKTCNCNQIHPSFPLWKHNKHLLCCEKQSASIQNNSKNKNRILHYGVSKQWGKGGERQHKM